MSTPLSDKMRTTRLGNYEPLLELASGGMATVYIARQVAAAGFERLVVIKRVHRHLLGNRDFTEMFRDEARMCSMIRHPNVVPVIDVVEADGELLLVLEYVESLSLSTLTRAAKRNGGALKPAVVSRICADALAGLHAAHEAVDLNGTRIELIHRDVSPQNVIVGVDGSSRLIDFGIAKAASRASVTNSGVVKGKLRYMSPEQVKQKPLDRRADIFAAGVVLYEALTGSRPFAGADADEGDLVVGILIGEAAPPSSLVAGLSPHVDSVLEKALTRDRNERFRTAAEFQEALERALPPAAARDVATAVESLGIAQLGSRREELKVALAKRQLRWTERPPADEAVTLPTPSAAPGRRWTTMIALSATAAAIVAIALLVRKHETEVAAPLPALSVAPATAADSTLSTDTPHPPATSTSTPPVPATSHFVPVRRPAPRPSSSTDLHRHNPYDTH